MNKTVNHLGYHMVTMDLRLLGFLAFLMCLQARVNGHPTQFDWKTSRNKAIQLNELARTLTAHMNEPCRNMSATFKDDLKMEARVCDPYSMTENLQQCRLSIIGVLQNFLSIFGENGLFNSDDAKGTNHDTNVSTAIAEILKALGGIKNDITETRVNKDPWQHCILRKHAVMRLFSFSILLTRVFSFVADGMAFQSPNHCQ